MVATQLATAADTLASRLDDVHGYQWERPGRRSDGALFTVATFVRYFIHDPIHHLHDVTGRRYPDSDETDRRGTRDHAAGRAGAILWSNSPEPYQTVRDRRGLRGVGRGRVGCRSSRWRVCGRRMGGFGGCRSGVEQEIWGILLVHHAIRDLIHTSARDAGLDPDRVSFTRTLRAARRQVADQAGLSPLPAAPRRPRRRR